MTKISATVVAHNEEKKIEDCLRSLDFVDEIVVVLDKCSDGTKEIVKKYTNKIIEGSWNIEGARRNVSLDNCSGDWIVEIDADERISEELAVEIKATIAQIEREKLDIEMLTVPIHNHVGSRLVKYGWLRILAPTHRQITKKGVKKYHEDKRIHPTADFKEEVKTKALTQYLIHLMDDDIFDMIARFNRFTNWMALDMVTKGKVKRDVENAGMIGFCKEIVKFKMRFIKSFFFKKGYKEGALGFVIAILAGLYPIVCKLKAKEIIKNKYNENS